MHANSRSVISNQSGCHENLETVVLKHLNHAFRRPATEKAKAGFEQASAFVVAQNKPIILDLGCGTGHSSVALAQQYSNHCIIGIDKSAARLTRHPQPMPENCLLLRSDVQDFLPLAVAAGWRTARLYLLYPNPWPKSVHFKRRWQGSPLFPLLLQLGGELEARSNWETYIDELGQALHIAGFSSQKTEVAEQQPALTLFEEKYRHSGHQLWCCRASV